MTSLISKAIPRSKSDLVAWPGRALYFLERKFNRYLPSRIVTMREYKRRNGFYPDLRHPKDFSEKICWLKLNVHSELHTRCADKVAVRDYVTERCGSGILVPLILVSDDISRISPEHITNEKFVLKTNHDNGGVVICRDRVRFDWNAAREKIRTHLQRDYYFYARERQYRTIERKFLVEEFIEKPDGSEILNIKVWCFHGVPQLFHLGIDLTTNHRQAFYDADWTRLDLRRRLPTFDGYIERPSNFAEIVEVCRALSAPFAFARVDLYDTGGRLFFGEITFHPGAGYTRFTSREFERKLGDYIRL